MTLQEAKDSIHGTFPSVWSRSDVLTLLDQITEPKVQVKLTSEMLDELRDKIVEDLDREGFDLFDISDADFDVNVRSELRLEIEIDGGIELDSNIATNCVEKSIEEWLAANSLSLDADEDPDEEKPY